MTEVVFESSDATELAVTFIEVTRSVTQGAETVEIFTELAEKCVRLLPVSAAGILLRDVEGTLQVIGASSPSAHLLDLFQVQNEEGPCLECTTTGSPVSDDDLRLDGGRWPRFAELARAQGFASVGVMCDLSGRDRILVAQRPSDAASHPAVPPNSAGGRHDA